MYLPHTFVLGVARVEELGRDFREQAEPGIAWIQFLWFLIPTVMIAASIACFRISERASGRLKEADGLLTELYLAHQFTKSARLLCNKIADTCDLSDPAMLMASPKLFEQAVTKANQTTSFSKRQRETLDWVRQRLFAA